MAFEANGDPNRPLDSDAVYYIRLWHLGAYNGATAVRTLTIPEICKVLHRSESQVRTALGDLYRTKGDGHDGK